MAEGDVAPALAAAVGQTLPAAYLDFLDGLPSRPTLGEGYGPILRDAGLETTASDEALLVPQGPAGAESGGTAATTQHEPAGVAR